MNLITSAWIPVLRDNGTRDFITPYQIVENIKCLDFPRADFNSAITQFLIGLLQTCFAPKSEKDWKSLLNKKPSALTLKKAFSKKSKAFNLSGKSPLFMQDTSPKDYKEFDLFELIMDGAGKKTINERKDFFKKADSFEKICPSCAAALIYTLQTNATSRGMGYFPCIRGGKPMALMMLAEGDTLWENLWLNVLPKSLMKNFGSGKVLFPWTSKYRKKATPRTSDPCHVYWEMPRRLCLEFQEEKSLCDCCNNQVDKVAIKAWMKSPGTQYPSSKWNHPLCPTNDKGLIGSQKKKVGYTDLAKIICGLENNSPPITLRQGKYIFAFGANFISNSKFCGWVEKRIPWFDAGSKELIQWMLSVQAKVFKITVSKIASYWSEAPLDNPYASLENSLEPTFYQIIQNQTNAKQRWLEALMKASLKEFDEYSDRTNSPWKSLRRKELIGLFDEMFKKEDLELKVDPSVTEEEKKKKSSFELSNEFCSDLLRWWSGHNKFDREALQKLRKGASLETATHNKLYFGLMKRFQTHHKTESNNIKRRVAVAAILLSHVRSHGPENFAVTVKSFNGKAHVKNILQDWRSLPPVIDKMPSVNIISLFDYVLNK